MCIRDSGTAATLKFTLRHDKRNNIFEPSDGYYGSFSLENAGFYGDQSWLKASLEGRYYKPVYEELVFRSRVRVDQIMKTESNRNIPRTEQFQMGGSRNMRGFNYEDIGPQTIEQTEGKDTPGDTSDDVYKQFNAGGTFSVLGQFELEHPLVKEAGLKWVLFYDAGNVYKNEFDQDDFRLRQDYGFGFRWFSPIGVLRFEFGYPIDPEEGEEGQQFHFDIGQLF